LLSMMKNASSLRRSDLNMPSVTDDVNINSGWAQREKKVNLTTIKCNERTKSLNTDIKGWRVVDGQKTYTTFRNGKVVSASGFEGFKLSSGDKPKEKSVMPGVVDEQKVGSKRKADAATVTAKASAGPKQQQIKW